MTSFKTLNTKKYQKATASTTADTLYWKRLSPPTLVKEFGAIDYIDFNPIEPHYFAVTCSVRVQIYNPVTKLVVKNLSRFQEVAHGGTFRQDGRLLVAGDEQAQVKLFDISSKNVLRMFKGHKGPVHRARFTTDMLRIASFSDDKTVKLWDIAAEKALHTYEAHEDYIRAGCVNPASSDVVVSGGYDGKIKLYDTRQQDVLFTIDHGAPVESLLFLPTGGIFLSAGGTEVRVWDAFGGCRLLTKLSQHHKTVTCLQLGSNGKRILSGGLDRHVKIYDVASYQTVHTLDFPSAILSLGVAPNDQTLAVGMVDGLVSIQNMETNREKDEKDSKKRSKQRHHPTVQVDHEVVGRTSHRETKYDLLLRRYEYVECLTAAMRTKVIASQPEVTVSVMQELIRRKGLHRALAGRTNASLSRIIGFICGYIGEARFMRVLTDVASVLLDVYEDSFHEFSEDLSKEFLRLAKTLEEEIALSYDLLELQGALELLMEAANVANERDDVVHFVDDKRPLLKPSRISKETAVVTV